MRDVAVKNRILPSVFIVLIVSLPVVSCELFDLSPAERANPMDPSSDVSIPWIVSVTPEDGSQDVETDQVVIINFSEAIDEKTVTSETFSVTTAGIQLSGNLSVSNNLVTFSPETEFSGDHTYSVKLTSGIANKDGRGMQADVSYSFATRRRLWGSPVLLESSDSGDVFNPQAALDLLGNAIAVWSQSDGSAVSIWTNRYIPGTGWGTAALLEYTDNAAYTPQVAVDPAGNGTAVWAQYDGISMQDITAGYFESGYGWGAPGVIESFNAGDAFAPKAVMLPSGDAFCTWYQYDGAYRNICFNHFDPGNGSWNTAAIIDERDDMTAINPQIAADASGNIFVVWTQSDGTADSIWSRRYAYSSSSWDDAEIIEASDAAASKARIAAGPVGKAASVWLQIDGAVKSLWGNIYDSTGGGWGTAVILESKGTDADDPQIVMDSSGNAVVIWSHTDAGTDNIYSNRYEGGFGWLGEEIIETDNAGDAAAPQAAVDSAGNIIAVWAQSDVTRYNIWHNRYSVGTGWGSAALLEIDNTGSAEDPQISINDWGDAVVIWRQTDGTNYNTYAAHYR